MDSLVHFLTYHKIYVIAGAVLLLFAVVPTRNKISGKTQKALYVGIIIWIICFAYKINTGDDIIELFTKSDDAGMDGERSATGIEGGPFNKYYNNDAGRKSKF